MPTNYEINVDVPPNLRHLTDGQKTVVAEWKTYRFSDLVDEFAPDLIAAKHRLPETRPAPDLGHVVLGLTVKYPGLREHLLDDEAQLARHVNVFIGTDDELGENAREIGGIAAEIALDSYVRILPVVAGGDS